MIKFINYRKELPNASSNCWDRLFYFEKRWRGKLWYIGVKHFCIVIDLRKNWIMDMKSL